MENYTFKKPIIILSAPRSGSTLLFEALAKSNELLNIGDESHGVFENNTKFHPRAGFYNSNVLTDKDASPEVIAEIKRRFFNKLCQQYPGFPASQAGNRLLEKTPKNALRVSFLEKIFPDALYIYLYRNPRENISSIIDGWHSKRFVMYPNLPGREGKPMWSYLLPDGWENYHNSSIAEIAAFQWQQSNETIVNELSKMNSDRWLAISYQQLIEETHVTLTRLGKFCQLQKADEFVEKNPQALSISRYTLTKPEVNKWHKNAHLISGLIPELESSVSKIQTLTGDFCEHDFDLSMPNINHNLPKENAQDKTISRNSPCYCGSQLKYRHCHGKLG